MSLKNSNKPIEDLLKCFEDATKCIPQNPDPYLDTYSILSRGVQKFLNKQTKENFLIAGCLIYSWMPCCIGFTAPNMLDICKAIKKVTSNKDTLIEDGITALAEALRPAVGKESTVAASKFLHFFAPEKYPMFDRNVKKIWGGIMDAQNYLKFINACQDWKECPRVQTACKKFKADLDKKGHCVKDLKNIRLIELALFLAGQAKRKKKTPKNTPAKATKKVAQKVAVAATPKKAKKKNKTTP